MRNNLQRRSSDFPQDDDFQRSGGTNELNFSNDLSTQSFVDLDIETEKRNQTFDFQVSDYSKENNSLQNATDDDLEPETLIHEDGALSPYESGDDQPTDIAFTIVGEREIGGGSGLDEAELALKDPLDGKPWNGKESES